MPQNNLVPQRSSHVGAIVALVILVVITAAAAYFFKDRIVMRAPQQGAPSPAAATAPKVTLGGTRMFVVRERELDEELDVATYQLATIAASGGLSVIGTFQAAPGTARTSGNAVVYLAADGSLHGFTVNQLLSDTLIATPGAVAQLTGFPGGVAAITGCDDQPCSLGIISGLRYRTVVKNIGSLSGYAQARAAILSVDAAAGIATIVASDIQAEETAAAKLLRVKLADGSLAAAATDLGDCSASPDACIDVLAPYAQTGPTQEITCGPAHGRQIGASLFYSSSGGEEKELEQTLAVACIQ